MTDENLAFQEESGETDLLPWENKQEFQRLFSTQAVRSYLYLSLGMGLLALFLPIALIAAGGYDGHYSISYFYHVSELTRNILVGCLWAVGVFLFLFQGLSRWENWILNLGGLAAIGVAMLPMAAEQCGAAERASLHGISAFVFFMCLAAVAIFFSKTRIQYIIHPPKKQRFKLLYNLAGLTMTVMPMAVVALYFLAGGQCENHWIFWVEVLGIAGFAFYWFVKTAEYRMLLRVKWVASEYERRQWAEAREKKLG